jgi:hypothetical protein
MSNFCILEKTYFETRRTGPGESKARWYITLSSSELTDEAGNTQTEYSTHYFTPNGPMTGQQFFCKGDYFRDYQRARENFKKRTQSCAPLGERGLIFQRGKNGKIKAFL